MSKLPDDSNAFHQSFVQAGDWFKELGRALNLTSSGPLAVSDAPDLRRPSFNRPLPRTGIISDKPQIVAGILLKYVNLGAGWRHRLFVLQDGVIRYYKVLGANVVRTHEILDGLREQGDLYLIGAEVALLEESERWDSSGVRSARRSSSNVGRAPPPAQGEVHVQVATLRESSSDYRKFYIHTGTTTLSLRAETTEDRWVWVEALRASKAAWQGLTPTEAGALARAPEDRILSRDDDFLELLSEAERRLASLGVRSREAQSYVQDLLLQEHQKLHQVLVAEENKRAALLRKIYQLENARRELETALVVEGRQSARVAARAGGFGDEGAPSAESPLGGAGGFDAADSERAYLPDGEETDTEDDEFFDAEEVDGLARAGSRVGLRAGHARRRSLSSSLTPSGSFHEALLDAENTGVGTTGGLSDALTLTQQLPRPSSPDSSDPAWVAAELARGLPPRRAALPPPAQQEKTVSLWSLIKGMVGKDLSRVCLPVYFNEPLSALEKQVEDLEYSELLDAAARLAPGSTDRLLYVAAFAVSGYSATAQRTAKPFNPLLGETYELVAAEKGLRVLAEKVVHHPTVLAMHAEGRAWTLDSDADVHSKFWGRSIELRPEGVQRLAFADGDVYVWNKVTTSINNLVLGKIYVDHGGIMRVRGLRSGLCMRVRFKETGIFDRDPRQVRGVIERGAEKFDRPTLQGHWDDALEAELEDGSRVELWRRNPPARSPTRYNLTAYAIALNEVRPGDDRLLAPTDCRRRPDQHFLELGEYDKANEEKQRLEHKQRAARKAAERGDPIRPRWFELVPGAKAGEEPSYRYSGGYWEARQEGSFSNCRDIFGVDPTPAE
ncbi:hypothetical protein QBZ16_003196 [Prototheca wickerhamii]|uniref:PH domain-containing protein n=1 Tax=Prototheca wickerhamii TaxID=3111 RepID=A0AAD9III8_PROWI|nr:hypothetical protein QBZ16_003196 [Prototheca wickerhamii]